MSTNISIAENALVQSCCTVKMQILMLSLILDNELRSRATTFDQKKTPKIQDWNPRKEHQLLNRIVLERLETTIPYKWKEEYKNSTKTQPQYHYVL